MKQTNKHGFARWIHHLAVQLLHRDKVQRLQGVTGGSDEIQADVDSCVMVVEQRTLNFHLLLKIPPKLGIDIVQNRFIAAKIK